MAALTRTPNFKLPIPAFGQTPWQQFYRELAFVVDGVLATSIAFSQFTGAWQNSTAYLLNDQALDTDTGAIYKTTAPHTSIAVPNTFAQARTASPTLWTPVSSAGVGRGVWAAGTNYAANDFVTDNGRFAVCLVSHVAVNFNNDVTAGKWSILVDLSSYTPVTVPVSIAQGGTGQTTAPAARAALGLTIGSQIQAWSQTLDVLVPLTPAVDKIAYFSGPATALLVDFTGFGRSLVDDLDAASARTTLGLTLPLAIASGGTGATSFAAAGLIDTAGSGLTKSGTTINLDVNDLVAETAPAIDDHVPIYDASAATTDKMRLDDVMKTVNVLTEDTSPDEAADFLLSYDTSATAAKKVLMNNVGIVKVAILQDQKADGTNGGSVTAVGAWETRDLNTEVSDPDGIVSITANQFTLIAGKYLIRAISTVKDTDNTGTRMRIRNVTDSSDAALSLSGHPGEFVSYGANYHLVAEGYVNIATSKAFEIQMMHSVDDATADQLGQHDLLTAGVEVYTQVMITKIG